MTDDIDMWNDMQVMEKKPKLKKQRKAMFAVYNAWYMEGDEQKAKRLIKVARKKFPKFNFDFGGYGIPEPTIRKKLKKVM